MPTGSYNTIPHRVVMMIAFFLIVSSVVYAAEQNTTATIVSVQSYDQYVPKEINVNLVNVYGPDKMFNSTSVSLQVPQDFKNTRIVPKQVSPSLIDIKGPDKPFTVTTSQQEYNNRYLSVNITNFKFNYNSDKNTLTIQFQVQPPSGCSSLSYDLIVTGDQNEYTVLATGKQITDLNVSDSYTLYFYPEEIYIFVQGCSAGVFLPYVVTLPEFVINSNIIELFIKNYNGFVTLVSSKGYAIGRVYVSGQTKAYVISTVTGRIRVSVLPG